MKVCALIFAIFCATTAQAQAPSDGSGAYATHHYRDLFTQARPLPRRHQRQINRAFQQLFHGDDVTERAGFEAGSNANGPLAYLTDWANNDAGTEGMLYLMSFLHVNGNFRISDWKLGAP